MIGACSDHGGLGDWYICIFRHILADFLFSNVNRESSACIDWFVEFVEVVVDLGLGDFCVISYDLVIDVADGDPV